MEKTTEKNALGLSPMLQEAIRQEQERRAADPVWRRLCSHDESIATIITDYMNEDRKLQEYIEGKSADLRRLLEEANDKIAWLERTVKLNEELRLKLSNRILHLEELAEKQEETINRLWRRIGALELAVFPATEEEDDFFEETQK